MAIEIPKKDNSSVSAQENTVPAKPSVSIQIELMPTSENEMIGNHSIFTPYGAFHFKNGIGTATEEQAKQLKKDGYIK